MTYLLTYIFQDTQHVYTCISLLAHSLISNVTYTFLKYFIIQFAVYQLT